MLYVAVESRSIACSAKDVMSFCFVVGSWESSLTQKMRREYVGLMLRTGTMSLSVTLMGLVGTRGTTVGTKVGT